MAAHEGLDAVTPHAPSSPQLPLLAGAGALFAVLLVAAGSGSPRGALLALALPAGAVGFGAIVRFAPQAACDCLLLLFVGLIAIPIDGHLAYQEHIGGWPGLRVAVADLPLYLLAPLTLLGVALGRIENTIPRTVLALMALMLAWYAIAALGAPNLPLAAFDIFATARGFLIAWMVAALFRRNLLGALIAMLALQVVLHGAFAIAQGATGRPIGAGWFGGLDEVLLEPIAGRGEIHRPAGLFTHPITFAAALLITLPLFAARLATQRGFAMRLLLLAALAFGGAGLALSLARGVWIASVVAILVLAVLVLRCRLVSPRQIRSIAFAGLAAGLVFGIAFGPRIYDRFTKSDARNLESRIDMNRIAFGMIAANPVFGTGPNNYAVNLPRYDTRGLMDEYAAPVHNLYLLEAAEAGIPGLLVYLALIASILFTALHVLPRMHDRELQWFVAAWIAAFTALMLSQATDFSIRLEPLRSMVWLEIGLLFGVLHVDRARRAGIKAEPSA